MQGPERKRVSKKLLVAALGVATVSYMGSTGCAPDSDTGEPELGDNSAPYDDETAPEIGSAQQNLNVTAVGTAQSAAIVNTPIKVYKPKIPGSGNLMPPPGDIVIIDSKDGPVFDPLPGSGNLMAPPEQLHDHLQNLEVLQQVKR